MAKQNVHYAHFSTGEFSAAGMARIDLDQTRLSAEVQENIFSHAIGKGQCRPGTEKLDNTPDNAVVRLIPFVRETSDVAVLEMSDGLLRVMRNDEFISRVAVNCTVTNGDFSDATGWTLTASDGANGSIANDCLTMDADARGSQCFCERAVTTTDIGVVHALNIVVTRGPVYFRCGTTSNGADLIAETPLDTGFHSLAFTPTGGTFYVRLLTRGQRDVIVDSIQIAAAGIMEIEAPWTADQLQSIRFDQSANVIFLANRNWQQRKIERRGVTSWSLAVYEVDDGPFRASPGNRVALTPAQTYGNTTISADSPVFSDDMVGSLLRLYHQRFDTRVLLAGDNTFTDVFTLRGIKATYYNDRKFAYQTTGTWAGELRLQRSLTGPDGDFLDLNMDDGSATDKSTSNLNVVHNSEMEDNNVISYTRLGFIDGGYTSGTITIDVQYEGFSGYGICRITDVTDAQTVEVEILENLNADTSTRSWEIGAWSQRYGWPSAVVLYDGRLWWGSEDDFWGSASDAYYTFDDLEEGDGGTITRQVATGGQVSRVNWFLPLQRLIVGTTGAEVSVRSSSFDEPLTPSNITLKDASTVGSGSVSPVKIDSRGIFVHRSGNRVMALLYSFDANDYRTDDLTEFNEDICGDSIEELCVQREPETYVWCVRSDGQVAILIYAWDEQRRVMGWSRFVTDGEVESVCTVPGAEEDRVYLAVKRTIDGNTVRFIEKVCLRSEAIGNADNGHKMADCGVFNAGPVSSITAAHLANETDLVGWGFIDGVGYPLTGLTADGSGLISLGDTYENVFVGLKYSCKYKSSKLAYAAQGGTALLQRKKVTQFGTLLANTHRDAIRFGPNFDTLRNMDLVRAGAAVADTEVYSVYDEVAFSFPGEWSSDSRLCLQVDAPYPATFLGLLIGIETND